MDDGPVLPPLSRTGSARSLNHRRRRIFARPRAFERISAGLDFAVQIARLAAGPAQLVELIVVRFELVVSDAPVLNGEIVVRNGLLAVTLLVVAFGQEVGDGPREGTMIFGDGDRHG